MSQAKTLHERRLKLIKESRTIAEAAAEANRPLDAEEERQYTELNAEIDALATRIDAIVEGEKRAKASEDAFAELEGRKVEKAGGDARDEGLRAFLRGETRSYTVKPNGPVNYRDLVKGTATAGGNTVPTSFFDRLIAHLIETAALMETNPTVLNTDSGEDIQVPKTTAHSTAVTVGEAVAIPESDPTFGQTTLGAIKKGVMIQVARELIDDTGVDLEGYLAMQAGRALGNAHGSDWSTTVVNDSSLGVTGPDGAGGGFGTQSTADEGFDLLIDLFHSVIAPYRRSRSAFWAMSDLTAAEVRKIKNADGIYAWQPSTQLGQPDLIFGKPVVIDPFIPDVATSTESVLFGDFSQLFIRIAGGVRFERSDDFAFANDLVSFRALMRADAALVDLTGAIRHFLGGT